MMLDCEYGQVPVFVTLAYAGESTLLGTVQEEEDGPTYDVMYHPVIGKWAAQSNCAYVNVNGLFVNHNLYYEIVKEVKRGCEV